VAALKVIPESDGTLRNIHDLWQTQSLLHRKRKHGDI